MAESRASEDMLAIAITRPGGPEVLQPVRRAVPVPGPGEVLVRVKAAGVNHADLLERRGDYPSPIARPDVPGLEIAGVVEAVSADVTGIAAGDEVCALTAGGGYASHCVVPAPQVLALPRGFGMAEGAALPEVLFTVWTNLFDTAALKEGETVLIHGGASGIGTAAIQLAKAFGARVLVTSGTARKCEACLALGADAAINYRSEDFVEAVLGATDGAGADVILDMVGGDYVQRNIACLAMGGRIVNISFPHGAVVEVDFMPLMRKCGMIAATMLRPRSIAEKGRIAAALHEKVWPLLESGRIRPVIDRTFPLTEAPDAHRVLEAGDHIGKLLLLV